MRVPIDNWAWLPKEELSSIAKVRLKQDLTIYPSVYSPAGQTAQVKPIRLYVDHPKFFGVARQYFVDHKSPDTDIDDRTVLGNRKLWAGKIGLKPGVVLRPEQARALDDVSRQLKSPLKFGGILRASPGWGKTVFGAALIAELGIPAMVVVHKDFLMDQWVQRLEQFLDGPKIGMVKQGVCDYAGKHVVIAMIHSITGNRDYPKGLWDWPGIVIYDELHRVGSAVWSKAVTKFKARYRIGLTATPRRKDGADDVFFQHVGPIIFRAREQRMKPKVKRVWTGFKLVGRLATLKGANKATLLRPLCSNPHRNRVILAKLFDATKAGRKVLLLSDRLKHLEALKESFERSWPKSLGDRPTTAMYVGSTSREDRKKAEKADVIFATSQLVSEGFDVPALDTLFLTTPLSDVEQATGRILRPCEGKKDPIVVDFRDDSVPLFRRMAAKRENIYQKIT